MQFSPCVTFFLGTLLWTSVAAAEVTASENVQEVITQAEFGTTALSGTTPMEGDLEGSPLTDPLVQPERDLSTLGIMAFGLVGLFWVRRHASGL